MLKAKKLDVFRKMKLHTIYKESMPDLRKYIGRAMDEGYDPLQIMHVYSVKKGEERFAKEVEKIEREQEPGRAGSTLFV